jgi:tetratricopeptide (TPR) repeat protein
LTRYPEEQSDNLSELDTAADAENLFILLDSLSNSHNEKAIHFTESEEYNNAALEYSMIARAYDKAVHVINSNPTFSELKNLSKTFSETAKYWENLARLSKREATITSINEGINFMNLKNYNEAIKAFEEAIETNPDDYETYLELGNAYYYVKKFKDALYYYDKALEINPNLDYLWNNKGLALIALKRNDEALKYYDKAIRINPHGDNVWNGKGNALSNLRKFDEAIECYDKALEINQNNADAWNGKGFALNSLGKFDEAIECYDKALEIDPNFDNAWTNKGFSLSNLGRFDEAMKLYDKALEINQNNADAWNGKGSAFYALRKYDEAVMCYDKLLELNPSSVLYRANKSESLLLSGKYVESESIAKETRDSTTDPNYKLILGHLIACSLYLRGLVAAREVVLDLLNYYESVPIYQRLPDNWSFDRLAQTISDSNLAVGPKAVLRSLIDLIKLNDDTVVGDKKTKRLEITRKLLE